MDNIPEKFRNNDGTLNADALIKSYSELEKKMGSMVSVPNENSDDESRQRFNRAIGVPENRCISWLSFAFPILLASW